jgi:mRNA-degrading endonuclease RelE of RelBE toxin-antitoxin system
MSSDIDGYEIYQEDKKFERAVANLPEIVQKVLKRKIRFLAENPYHNSLNTKQYHCSSKAIDQLKREGVDDVREFYVSGKKYRCIFYIIRLKKILYLAMVGSHDQLRNWSK